MNNSNYNSNAKIILATGFLLLVCTLILAGCSAQDKNNQQNQPSFEQDSNNSADNRIAPQREGADQLPQGSGGPGSARMNITDEQREAMMKEIQQQEINACQDKAEGDSCTMQNTRGNMTGVCQIQDSKLMCRIEMEGGPGQPPPN